MRIRSIALASALALTASLFVGVGSVAAAKPCPSGYTAYTYAELEDFVIDAGGDPSLGLEPYFEHIDANGNGTACFKTLPEATPYPTPPLLGHDDKA
jgi:hypothetical protein